MLSLTPKGTAARIPVQIITSTLARARPIMGAAAAVAVDAFWRIGLITIKAPPGVDYMAISFVAGFSDRLLLSAIVKTFGLEPAKPGTTDEAKPKNHPQDAKPPK
jgi:hypothetical protein